MPMTPLEWMLSNDTGISSKTICAVMTGSKHRSEVFPIPHDADDFGRCLRLVWLFPAWRPGLSKVAEAYPEWGPIVRDWDLLEALYMQDTAFCSRRLLALQDECREAAGWKRTGVYSWEKVRE